MEDRRLEFQANMLMQKYELLEAEYREVLEAQIDPTKPPIRDNLREQAAIMAKEQAERAARKAEGLDDPSDSTVATGDASDSTTDSGEGKSDNTAKTQKPDVPFDSIPNEELFADCFDNSIHISHVQADKIKDAMKGLDITPPSWAGKIDDETFRNALKELTK